jgi:hypothetical protein
VAFEVVQKLLVHGLADLGADLAAERPADQATQRRASDRTQQGTGGTGDKTDRGTQVRAAQGTGSTTGSTRNGAERSSSFAAERARTNPGGLALGTDRHKHSLKNRVEGK